MMPPPQIPADLAGAYGVRETDVRFLTHVQNYTFAYQRDGAEFILQLTPGTHQSAEQVKAEVEWVNDLAARDREDFIKMFLGDFSREVIFLVQRAWGATRRVRRD